MGSLVLAMPAVRLARETYPGAAVYFLVFANLAESVAAIGLTTPDRVFTIDPSSLFTIARDTWRFMRDARRHRIDTVVNLEMFARFGAILTFLSGAGRRAGFHAYDHPGLYCGDLLTHRVIYNPHVHTAEALLTIVRSLEEPADHVPMGKLPRTAAGGLEPADTGHSRRPRHDRRGDAPAGARRALRASGPPSPASGSSSSIPTRVS